MSGSHQQSRPPRPAADVPTLSLLRLSALQRVTGAALVLAGLWTAVIAILDRG
jgi:hypothetical protein